MTTTRELHRQKYTAQIHQWAAQLDVLSTRLRRQTDEDRTSAQPHLDALRVRLDRAEGKLGELGDASDESWGALARDAEDVWSETQHALLRAAEVVWLTPEPSAFDAREIW
jgi:hypothetical protein